MSELAKKRIAEAMSSNSTSLNLEDCELKELNEIPELFDLLPNLQSLDLSYNQLTRFSIIGVFPHLESLILHSNQLKIAANLQCFPHLRHLDLNGNQLTDLSTLINLPELRHLDLSSNQLKKVLSIKNLVHLKYLDLSDNQLKNLPQNATWSKLEILGCSVNQLTNLSGLAEMPNLKSLFLKGNQLKDLKGLMEMPQLEYLALCHNQLTSLSGLPDLPQLEYLHLQKNQLTDLENTGKMPCLKRLYLHDNQLNSLSGMVEMPLLKVLNLQDNRLKDLTYMEGMPSLECLNLNRNQLVNLEGMVEMPHLKELELINNKLVDLSGMTAMRSLKILYLQYNQLKSLSGMANLFQIKSLDLSNNQLETLSGIVEMSHLKSLTLKYNELINLEGMAQIPNLTYLNLARNQLFDLSGMVEMPHLKKLSLSGNPLSTLEGMVKLPSLEALYLRKTAFKNLTGIVDLPKLQTLNLAKSQLTSLEGMPNFPNLQNVDLYFSQLEALPEALFQSPQLESLCLIGNPLPKVPKFFYYGSVKSSLENIQLYFNSINKSGAAPCPPIKLPQIGDDYIGNMWWFVFRLLEDSNVETSVCEVEKCYKFRQKYWELPKSWVMLYHRLEKKLKIGTYSIDKEQFVEACMSLDIEGERTQQIILDYFHEMYFVYHKNEVFNNQIILGQQLIIEAIEKVLVSPDIQQKFESSDVKEQCFSWEDAQNIWSEGYTDKDRIELLEYMEGHGLAFNLSKESYFVENRHIISEYVIPQLLPKVHPKTLKWNNRQKIWHYRVFYTSLPFLIEKRWVSFIGSFNFFKISHCWQNGLLMGTETGDSELLIELIKENDGSSPSSYFHLQATGKEGLDLLYQTRLNLQRLLYLAKEKIEMVSLDGKKWVSYLLLETAVKTNKNEVLENGGIIQVDDYLIFIEFLMKEEKIVY